MVFWSIVIVVVVLACASAWYMDHKHGIRWIDPEKPGGPNRRGDAAPDASLLNTHYDGKGNTSGPT
jgi:hypothetical protein